VIQLEVIVRVDETGQHPRTFEVHDDVPTPGGLIHREDTAPESQGGRDALIGHHPRVDQRDDVTSWEEPHDSLPDPFRISDARLLVSSGRRAANTVHAVTAASVPGRTGTSST
jgi:hypothetical protein